MVAIVYTKIASALRVKLLITTIVFLIHLLVDHITIIGNEMSA